MRQNWRSPRFWAWWWRVRAPAAAKISAVVVVFALLGLGGYVAADRLGSAVAATSEVEVMTVQKLITVREHGVVVTRPVRVVHNVTVDGQTVPVTQVVRDTVTTPGQTRVVTSREVRTVPVVRRRVVTVAGKPKTVTVNVTRATPTRTEVATVTNQRDVTTERVVTQAVTTTQPVTITRTVTQPVTVTQVATATVTTTLPVVTVTISIPGPP